MHIVRAEPAPSSLPLPMAGLVANEESAAVDRDALLSSYYELRDRVVQEAEAGHLEDALGLATRVLAIAERIGDQELIHHAYCTRTELATTLGHPADFGHLREILMQTGSYIIGFRAAYQIATGFGRKKQYKKALFYARIAHDRAVAAGNAEAIAKSRNEIGNCLLAESYFAEAISEYEEALELVSEELSIFHVAIFVNIGYSKIVQGDLTEGFRSLYAALRWCRRNPSENVYECWTHLALACGFMELKRWRYAWKHCWRGLELAESIGNSDAVKIGLYLMGEIEKSAGDIEAAYGYYSRLQREFYPDTSNLAGAMLFFDTKELVNLRA